MKKIPLITLMIILSASCQNTNSTKIADGLSGATITKKSNLNKRDASNSDWWPNRLNLDLLRKHSSLTNPMK